ncbi:NADH:ubiquinone oxidoreductase 13.4kD subunit [Coccidioides immitis H538.4]|uniref:NADH dehydrogenase [ubiquinone] 1 alpha subcomplex subunit n=1 Tax=Coccidioides immitis H538.4 TaxID=396776 RepID=A0A0J8S2X6_COCIT|nr:NADH:ubiquinone oxidoreductase 13.4kD subunit [Coccidioides immitis H538.4]
MSTITRTLRNLWRIGFKEYGHQMQYMGDTKAGTLVAIDRYGNKYYENNAELPLRTRWVDYKQKELDASHVEPGWHGWLAYMVNKPPTEDKIMQTGVRTWETPEHRPNPDTIPRRIQNIFDDQTKVLCLGPGCETEIDFKIVI